MTGARIPVLGLALVLVVAAVGAAAATGPNPVTQPPLDGCARDPAALALGSAPAFVYVNRSPLPQTLSGVVAAVAPAADVDLGVTPDSGSSFLLAAGGQTLVAARDATTFPAFSWPEQGDRVQLSGSWVWNCTKWKPAGERTELRPFRSLWVQRAVAARSPWGETEGDLFVSTDSTQAGVVADCALQPDFAACLTTQSQWQDVSGTYSFVLPAPPRPPGAGKLYARGASVVLRNGAAVVTITLASAPGVPLVVAKQVFVGWTKTPATELPQHLHIVFRSALADATCDAAGAWGPCSAARPLDVYLPRATPWRLAVYTTDGTIIRRFASPVAALGLHQDRARDFAVTYVVTRVNDALKRAATQPR